MRRGRDKKKMVKHKKMKKQTIIEIEMKKSRRSGR
jgi:hypothetical protein